jgi:hypothetical protein
MATKWMQGLHARLIAETGQGTVEYVALIVLLAAVFAGVVGIGGGDVGKKIAGTITEQVEQTIDGVAK